MLGAQALRTKQKVEKREKEKRQKERLRHLEIQREKCQKAAREDEAKFFQKMAALHIEDAKKLIADSTKPQIQKSASNRENLQQARASVGSCLAPVLPQKCLSADKLPLVDQTSVDSEALKEDEGSSSRIMKWLRLSHGSPKKKDPRRSSLYS